MEKMLSRRMVLIPALESEKFKSKKKTLQILIKKCFKGQEMKKVIIGTLLVFSINLSADVVNAIGLGIIEVLLPQVIERPLKSQSQRDRTVKKNYEQWNKFTRFLGFTDKEENLTNERFEDKRTSTEKQSDEKSAKEAEEKRIILAIEKSKKEAAVTTEECDWGE